MVQIIVRKQLFYNSRFEEQTNRLQEDKTGLAVNVRNSF